MRFEIAHELDAPIDTIELSFLSPELGAMLAREMAPSIASIETTLHEVNGSVFRRVLRFQASAPLSLFKGWTVARDALTWDTSTTFPIGSHTGTWDVVLKEQYRRYFRASGIYLFEAAPEGRTVRTVSGELEIFIPVPMMGGLVERVALAEVRRAYDAEAEALRKLATL